MSRYVFGTLDEAAEEEIKGLIEGSEDKTRQVSHLLRNQTEIVYKEFGAIQIKTKELERKTHILNQHQQDSQKEAALIVATQLLEENVLQYEIDVQTLTDVILFTQQGSIHPQFLNLTQIRETADLISRTISEAAFPASTDENAISGLVKISDVTILLYNFRLIYHIALPLIDFNTYQLFKGSSLPVLQRTVNKSNNFAYIWPSLQYFAVSISKNTYINMDPKALGNCKKLNKSYICPETDPDQILNARAGCEVKLAANIPIQNFSQCEIKIIELDTTFWARLNNPNTWVFSAKGQEKMVVNCERAADVNLDIKGSGILTLPPDVWRVPTR